MGVDNTREFAWIEDGPRRNALLLGNETSV